MSDIGTEFKQAVADNFVEMGSGALTTISYTPISGRTLDVDTSEMVTTKGTVETVEARFSDQVLEDIPGITISKDESGLYMPVTSLTAIPAEDDEIFNPSLSETWRVKEVHTFVGTYVFVIAKIETIVT